MFKIKTEDTVACHYLWHTCQQFKTGIGSCVGIFSLKFHSFSCKTVEMTCEIIIDETQTRPNLIH